jgi:hypothetical protein
VLTIQISLVPVEYATNVQILVKIGSNATAAITQISW